jgi:hypothetical protein
VRLMEGSPKMKRLVITLCITFILVSTAAAELYIAPDGTIYLDGAVNYISPRVPFMAGVQGGAHLHPGFGPYGPAAVSPFYWASYPMVPIPMVPNSGPIDAWAERLPRGR